MYVCLCKGLVESDVHRAARAGHVAAEALIVKLGLDDDDCCGRCAREIDTFVDLIADEAALRQPVERSAEWRQNRASLTC